jgi:hypothetical protein
MSSCMSCINTTCPCPITSIEQHTHEYVIEGDAATTVFSKTSFTGTFVTLPNTPFVGVAVQVFINGVLQLLTRDYTIEALEGKIITFIEELTDVDISVVFVPNTPTV